MTNTNKSKHTPAPWLYKHRKGSDGMYRTQVFTEDGETIATLHWYPKNLGNGCTGTYREENARLISMAPRMYDLLEKVQAWSQDRDGNTALPSVEIAQILAAIDGDITIGG